MLLTVKERLAVSLNVFFNVSVPDCASYVSLVQPDVTFVLTLPVTVPLDMLQLPLPEDSAESPVTPMLMDAANTRLMLENKAIMLKNATVKIVIKHCINVLLFLTLFIVAFLLFLINKMNS